MTEILNKFKTDDLTTYLEFCKKFIDFDVEEASSIATNTIKYYKGSKSNRDLLRYGQEIENKWYQSLEEGTPDYDLYNDNYFVIEIWSCWVVYSRRYIKLLKGLELPKINSVIDLGNGIGYTTGALKQVFKDADVYGTNMEGTLQFDIASKLGEDWNFKMLPEPNIQSDLIFASEYFEHIEEPIKHLQNVLDVCKPKALVIANSFGSKSMGHFDEYIYNGEKIQNKKIGRLFNKTLRNNNYKQLKTGFWNNRPTVWVKNETLTKS